MDQFYVMSASVVAGVAAIAYYGPHIVHDAVNESSKRRLGDWLLGAKLSHRPLDLIRAYIRATDSLYGPRLISLQAAAMTAIVSLGFITFLSAASYLLVLNAAVLLFSDIQFFLRFYLSTVVLLPSIFVTDFANTVFVRFVVKRFPDRSCVAAFTICVVCIAVGIVLFYLIYFASLVAFFDLHVGQRPLEQLGQWLRFRDLGWYMEANAGIHNLGVDGDGKQVYVVWPSKMKAIAPGSIYFYSSMIPSLWLALHLVLYGVLRATLRLDRFIQRNVHGEHIRERPVSIIAFFAFVAVSSLVALAVVIYALLR